MKLAFSGKLHSDKQGVCCGGGGGGAIEMR